MSGIEVIGVVLGAIPLVMAGLEHYREASGKFESMRNYKREFSNLNRRLLVENGLFKNALEQLILSLRVDSSLGDTLLKSPGGPAWRDDNIVQAMRLKLGSLYDLSVDAAVSMSQSLDDLRDVLQLDELGKGPFTDKRSLKETCRRVNFAFHKTKYAELIDEIRRSNRTFRDLLQQSSATQALRAQQQQQQQQQQQCRSSRKNVRRCASILFSSIQQAFQCTCRSSHAVSLHVKTISLNADDPGSSDQSSAAFRLVFHHRPTPSPLSPSWQCKEAVIWTSKSEVSRPVLVPASPFLVSQLAGLSIKATPDPSSSSTTTNITEIRDLCASMPILQSGACGACQGYLPDAANLMRHDFYLPSAPMIDDSSLMTLSLGELLTLEGPRYYMSVASRRKLAADLASCMLDLHDTPWLAKQWGHRETTFFQKDGQVLTDEPFLSTSVSNHNSNLYFDPMPAIGNETLFALGLLLIELCLNNPFEALILPSELNPDGTKHQFSEFLAAVRLVDKVDDEASYKYGDAVRKCMQSPFGRADLDNDAFRETLYESVISVLRDQAMRFIRT